MPEEPHRREVVLHGIAASPGVAHGRVFRFLHDEVEVPRYEVEQEDWDAEVTRFEEALLETRSQVQAIRADVAKSLGEEEAAIFDAHVLVLEDKALIDDVVRLVRETGENVEHCLHAVTSRYVERFEALDDEYLRERAVDVRDLGRRLLRNLLGATGSGTKFLDEPRVLVADDLTPSDAASLDRSKILGIATDGGGRTSHAVIMARATEVPAVVGLRGLASTLEEGDSVLLDGFEGTVVVNPSVETLFRYGKVSLRRKRVDDLVAGERDLPAETSDGSSLSLYANADSPEEVATALENGALGVGLFRTEALFLRRNRIPSEEEQFEVYKAVVEAAKGRPVTIRTLDIGGDKVLGGASRVKEDNPFMGFRAIRFCLRNQDVFLAQLRAILRASALGKVRVMFPMISGVGELLSARENLEEAKRQLRGEGAAFDDGVDVGCMIETPAAVTICDLLAEWVDFFSIGTNDLVQYLLAVDRINNQIAYLYEPHHPAVLRALRRVSDLGSQKGPDVSVCGEIAGDSRFTPLFVGMGITNLSMAPALLPKLKFFARRFSRSEGEGLLEKVGNMVRPSLILNELKAFHDDRMAGIETDSD